MGQSSSDGNDRWMMIKNDSALTALQVYIIPSAEDCCWSRDLLEDFVIGPRGRSKYVNFDDGKGTCQLDIRITNDYLGWDWNFYRIDVCNNRTITLKGELPARSKDGKNRSISVENQSSYTAHRIFSVASQQKDCCWSHDLLDVKVIPKGASLNVEIDDGSGRCQFDIRVTSSQDREWTFYGVDVCTETKITLK